MEENGVPTGRPTGRTVSATTEQCVAFMSDEDAVKWFEGNLSSGAHPVVCTTPAPSHVIPTLPVRTNSRHPSCAIQCANIQILTQTTHHVFLIRHASHFDIGATGQSHSNTRFLQASTNLSISKRRQEPGIRGGYAWMVSRILVKSLCSTFFGSRHLVQMQPDSGSDVALTSSHILTLKAGRIATLLRDISVSCATS